MWPLCLIASRFLKMDGEEVDGGGVIGGGGDFCSVSAEADEDGDGKDRRLHIVSHNSRSHIVGVPHIRQLYNWDCGLACILMVLRTLGIDNCELCDLEELCPTRRRKEKGPYSSMLLSQGAVIVKYLQEHLAFLISPPVSRNVPGVFPLPGNPESLSLVFHSFRNFIWTVDLAYLLHKFSVTFSFFTVTIGANPEFSAESFYKEQLHDDLRRVDNLFEKARGIGISIQHRSMSGKEISALILSGNYIAVALVDKYKLSNSWMKDICVPGYYGGSLDYIGHYLVICGYDMDTDQFDIRDPASLRKHEKVSLECLEAARKSFGTDEDTLLISLNRGDGKSKPSL